MSPQPWMPYLEPRAVLHNMYRPGRIDDITELDNEEREYDLEVINKSIKSAGWKYGRKFEGILAIKNVNSHCTIIGKPGTRDGDHADSDGEANTDPSEEDSSPDDLEMDDSPEDESMEDDMSDHDLDIDQDLYESMTEAGMYSAYGDDEDIQ
ncbi:5259_t:CDS:2 [Paraglomus occultum]|uniref:5259_t:CDS:1 n=1 Tax=Paraglomus occultum TaxID=144539 RepID=A0A9N8VBR8_9GLOM|nr:5259_t:CDS:2 [Paraglomus occultum]